MSTGLPPVIIFDLDGTLIDSVQEVCAALNKTLSQFGRRMLTSDEALSLVGEGLTITIQRASELTGSPLTQLEMEKAKEIFRDAYLLSGCAHTRVFPGVFKILNHLVHQNVELAICTNKSVRTAIGALETLGLSRYFAKVVCPEHVPNPKPDGGHLLACFDSDRILPEGIVYVGDSEIDSVAARDAGTRFVAVSYGYSHVPINNLDADAVIDDFSDLPVALAEIFR